MAVRNEVVRLSLEDNFSSGMVRAAGAAALLNRELNRIDGKNVDRDLDSTRDSVERLGRSADESALGLRNYEGRLRLLGEAAGVLGPALIPLSAAAIPALTAAFAGLGAAAGGIGLTVLAFNNMGKALKAIDAAQLEPTTENIMKMKVELENLGPAGAQFAHYIDSLEPAIKQLQETARAGLFPGLEAGIDDLVTRGPQVQRIIDTLATGMGNLARDAGHALSSEEWTPFFDYVEHTAQPTLEAFGRSTGNVALGLANMLVAFSPLTSDFTSGLERATQAFADWSKTLDDNRSFQAFVAYVRESGPQALHFLGGLADALSGLAQAAAPFGSIVLPTLTGVAKVFGTIAASPIGPGLYAAAGGLLAFNRAAKVASVTGDRLQRTWAGMSTLRKGSGVVGGLALLATSLTDVDEKAGLANTAMLATAGLMVGGPWGLAIGTGIGAVKDFHDAQSALNDEMQRSQDIARSGTLEEQRAEYERLSQEIHNTQTAQDDFVRSGSVNFSGDAIRGWLLGTRQQEDALSELAGAMRNTGSIADLFGQDIGQSGDAMRVAADDAHQLSAALAELNGWFDKRDAVRAYKDSIDALHKSLKDGFTREDTANIDAIGRSILKVAQNIQSPGRRAVFLENARAQLEDMAAHAAPKAAAAIQQVINKFDDKGLTHPPAAQVTVDDRRARATLEATKAKFKSTIDFMSQQKAELYADDKPARHTVDSLKGYFQTLVGHPYTATVTADTGQAVGAINGVTTMLRNLNGSTATTYIRTVRSDIPLPGSSADGGVVPKTGLPYADRHLYMLADGERVISNRRGQSDKYASVLEGINRNLPRRIIKGMLADGGRTGGFDRGFHNTQHGGGDGGAGDAISVWVAGVFTTAKALKAMKAELEGTSKALDKERTKLESLTSARDSLAGSTTSALLHDPFGNGLAGFNVQVEADTNDANAMLTALKTLVHNGLDPHGALFQALAASGDVNTAQQMAALTSSQLFAEQAAFGDRNTVTGQVGHFAGQQAFGDAIKDQTKATHELRDQVRHLNQAIKQMEHAVEKGAERGAHSGSRQGTREGNDSRDQHAAAEHRSGRR